MKGMGEIRQNRGWQLHVSRNSPEMWMQSVPGAGHPAEPGSPVLLSSGPLSCCHLTPSASVTSQNLSLHTCHSTASRLRLDISNNFCPERGTRHWQSHQPWRCSGNPWMWHSVTRCGSVRVELDALELFPNLSNSGVDQSGLNSMILSSFPTSVTLGWISQG